MSLISRLAECGHKADFESPHCCYRLSHGSKSESLHSNSLMVLWSQEPHLPWWAAAWGSWNEPLLTQVFLGKEAEFESSPARSPFFGFLFIFEHGSVTFIPPLSHYWASGLSKHLAHWRWQSGAAKRTLSPFTRPWIFWKVKETAQGHTENTWQYLKTGPQNSSPVSEA